jgi:hypothetical protein
LLKSRGSAIGIHPSYHSSDDEKIMIDEIDHLSEVLDKKVNISRQHYLRMDIKKTPQWLISKGISYDFTMGYAATPGFRAGTSFPFYYYDFNNEKSTDLLFVPFCAMDGAYTIYEKDAPDKAYIALTDLAREIKKVNGYFITVFHERTFSDHLYRGYGTLYKKLYSEVKAF